MAKSKITIKYPVYRNDWSHFKRFFILLGPCFPKKGELRSSWGLELIQDDEGTWQIETNAKYYLQDLGKEKMPRIGSIDLASILKHEVEELEREYYRSPKVFFSNLRKETRNMLDTKENRAILKQRVLEFKKNYRERHPVITRIKSLELKIFIPDEKKEAGK